MLQESPTIPHSLSQVLWLVLASSLGWGGAELRSWLGRRKREPVELAKLTAETRQITINTDITLIQAATSAIEKAEQRHSEWTKREDQMRTQILFWRNKAEELDGELIDSREAGALTNIRLKHHEAQEKKLKAVLDYHGISFAELDQPKS
jgi:hypothetical protein